VDDCVVAVEVDAPTEPPTIPPLDTPDALHTGGRVVMTEAGTLGLNDCMALALLLASSGCMHV